MAKGYLLVDGYNIIFDWEELANIAKSSLAVARQKLCDILCDYQGLTEYIIIVVFDAHRVEGGLGSIEEYHNITVVYTKEAETADHYIEQATRELAKLDKSGRRRKVTVATSDMLEQIIIISHGARRVSAGDLLDDIETAKKQIKEKYLDIQPVKNNTLAGLLDAETAKKLDAMRYGQEEKKQEKQRENRQKKKK